MKRRGGVLMVIGIILAVLVLIIAGAVFYFYNYHVFKEVRVCVGESENVYVPCEVREDCLEMLNISLDALGDSPEFVKVKAEDILKKAVYCEDTCFVRMIRGIDFESGELEVLESCEGNEEEIVMEIRGKEGLEIMEWMKSFD